MTRQAGFKGRVRARMAKTGESYATARSRLLAEHPGTTPGDSPLDWMHEALHISNGDATDVSGTGLARRVVYWRDVLHEGPVPQVAPAPSPGQTEPRLDPRANNTWHLDLDHANRAAVPGLGALGPLLPRRLR